VTNADIVKAYADIPLGKLGMAAFVLKIEME
jgi:hypothetical protein